MDNTFQSTTRNPQGAAAARLQPNGQTSLQPLGNITQPEAINPQSLPPGTVLQVAPLPAGRTSISPPVVESSARTLPRAGANGLWWFSGVAFVVAVVLMVLSGRKDRNPSKVAAPPKASNPKRQSKSTKAAARRNGPAPRRRKKAIR